MLEKAYGQLQEGLFEDAAQIFSDCLLMEPNQAKCYYGRGMARFNLKQWGPAVLDFQKARELNPEDPESSLALGMSLAADSQVYEAIEVFERLLAAQPKYIRAHLRLAHLYYRLGSISKGHQQLDLAMAARPSLSERKEVEAMKNEQLELDKKRYHRPDFELLRKQNQLSVPSGFVKILKRWFGKNG